MHVLNYDIVDLVSARVTVMWFRHGLDEDYHVLKMSRLFDGQACEERVC